MAAHEEGVKGQADDVGGKGEHHDVDLCVAQRHPEAVQDSPVGGGGVGVGLAHILGHAQLGDEPLLAAEAARVVRQVREDEGGGGGDSHGGGALDEEEPAPSGVAQDAVHVGEDAGADEGGEGVGDEVAAEEDGVARR